MNDSPQTNAGARAVFALPRAPYVLRQARVLGRSLPAPIGPLDFDGFAIVDILVEEGAIAKIAPAGAVDFGDAAQVAMSGRIVLPLFVDVHTHIDKGHIWRRKRNPVGDFPSALAATIEDRTAKWTAADVAARMEFSLRSAYAYGTGALRTHIDSVGPQTQISWPVVAEARERWRGRIDLQASPLFSDRVCDRRAHMARRRGDARRSMGPVSSARPPAWSRNCVRASASSLISPSARAGRSTSMSTKAADPAARSLKIIADMAIERRFAGRILVGHCCSLALQEDDERRRTIDAVARAGLSVVSCRCATCSCRTAWPAARRAGAASPRCMSSRPPASM